MRWAAAARVLLLAAVVSGAAAAPATAQHPDSVLVEVELAGIGAVVVVAEVQGATVRLPAAPVYRLAGLGPPPMASMTLDELRDVLQLEVVWAPRQLRLLLRDLHQALPASRNRLDQLRALAASRAGNVFQGRYTGPFGAVTVDDAGETLGELGYAARRAQVRATHSSRSGTTLQASVSPTPSIWLTSARLATGTWRLGARVAMESMWVSADYQMGRFGVDGAAAIGPLVLYASSRDRFALTWRGAVDVQLGHAGERSALRLSFGPVDPSPVSVPAVF